MLSDQRWVAVVAWSTIIAFTSLAIVAVIQHALLVGLGFLAGGLLGVVLALSMGSTRLDAHGITRRSGFGVFGIRWDEIRSLETDGTTWLLRGLDKHLPIVPSLWDGPERLLATQYLIQQFEAAGLQTTRSQRASYRLPRNVRIPPSAAAT
jgi:hypothetical protein